MVNESSVDESPASLLARLPEPAILCRWAQSLAILDTILSPEWADRYFSFDANWAPGEQMASMRDGSGNEWSITFTPQGAFLRGFDHESPTSPYAQNEYGLAAGLLDGLPAELRKVAYEPAFCDEGVPRATLAAWWTPDNPQWTAGHVSDLVAKSDRTATLFDCLDGNPTTYVTFALDYYEQELDLNSVSEVFEHRHLNAAKVQALNGEANLDELAAELLLTGCWLTLVGGYNERFIVPGSGSLVVNGVLADGATILDGGVLTVVGVLRGPLTIESGGAAFADGVVHGDVTVREGGLLEVSGVIRPSALLCDGRLGLSIGSQFGAHVVERNGYWRPLREGERITPESENDVRWWFYEGRLVTFAEIRQLRPKRD